MGDHDASPEDSVGAKLAMELLHALQEANRNSVATREVLIGIRDLMEEDAKVRAAQLEATDELCGRLEILSVAASLLGDVSRNSKNLDLDDVFNAIDQATGDVFPDDGEDDEDDRDDDGGGPDPDPVEMGGGRKRRRIS